MPVTIDRPRRLLPGAVPSAAVAAAAAASAVTDTAAKGGHRRRDDGFPFPLSHGGVPVPAPPSLQGRVSVAAAAIAVAAAKRRARGGVLGGSHAGPDRRRRSTRVAVAGGAPVGAAASVTARAISVGFVCFDDFGHDGDGSGWCFFFFMYRRF